MQDGLEGGGFRGIGLRAQSKDLGSRSLGFRDLGLQAAFSATLPATCEKRRANAQGIGESMRRFGTPRNRSQ